MQHTTLADNGHFFCAIEETRPRGTGRGGAAKGAAHAGSGVSGKSAPQRCPRMNLSSVSAAVSRSITIEAGRGDSGWVAAGAGTVCWRGRAHGPGAFGGVEAFPRAPQHTVRGSRQTTGSSVMIRGGDHRTGRPGQRPVCWGCR